MPAKGEQFGLKQETLDRIIHVFATSDVVEEVIIYGSRAKGNYREGSDIDITLKGEKLHNTHPGQFLRAIDELNLPWLFDISIYHLIDNPDLIDHIDRVGNTLYAR